MNINHPGKPETEVVALTLPRAKEGRFVRALRIVAFGVAALSALSAAAYAGRQYWTVWRFEESTDDAYVEAHIVPVAPQVAGYLATVLVADNQKVKAGDVLATIDPRSFKAAVDEAKADVAEAKAKIVSIDAQLAEQRALIDEADATLKADQATEVYAAQNDERFETLAKGGYGSVQNAQQAASQIGAANALVAKDKAALEAVRREVGTLAAQLDEANAALQHNQGALEEAELNLGYTVLRAPSEGVVGMRQLRVGLYVQPGMQLLAVVPLDGIYVVANYKETQLSEVTSGQKVRIDVDAFADTPVRGIVDSIAPASGQEFSLLPPDNATGNFTKIVQRIPVKIAIDRDDPIAGLLLPGMSVTATITVSQPPPDTEHGRSRNQP